jgi:hypothetical protein
MIPNEAGRKIAGKGENDKLVVKSSQLPLVNLKIEDQRDCKKAELNSKNTVANPMTRNNLNLKKGMTNKG